MDTPRASTDFEPALMVLCCPHALAPGVDFESLELAPHGCTIQRALVPCSSKIEVPHLLQCLERGLDGVQIIHCTRQRCQHLDGSARVEARVERARHLLAQVHMPEGRIALDEAEALTGPQLAALVSARVASIRALGQNPLTGKHHR